MIRWDVLAAARTLLLVLCGFGCMVAAAFLFNEQLGLVSLGAALLALAYLTDTPPTSHS